MRIGIDIGSTRVDAVLIREDGEIMAAAKQLTGQNAINAIRSVLKDILSHTSPAEMKGIFINTNHLLEALIQQKDLAKTALIRVSPTKIDIKPGLNWPEYLQDFIAELIWIEGGNEYNQAAQVKPHDLRELCKWIDKGLIEAVCIVGTYAPMYAGEEDALKKQIQSLYPDLPIVLSHTIGGNGFLNRENTALLNALFSKLVHNLVDQLSDLMKEWSLSCPCWLIQNNGSLMTWKEAIESPILSFASGITNSLKGVAKMTSLTDFIVIDIGGSMIEFGKMRNGQIHEVNSSAKLFGIDINLDFPEFLSLPFGSGSVVSVSGEEIHIKPDIVRDMTIESIAWGGKVWTVSDSFLRVFPDMLYDPRIDQERLAALPLGDCQRVVSHVMNKIKSQLVLLQDEKEELPVILVGGGSSLIPSSLFGKFKKVIHPSSHSICNAIGTCCSPISYVIDKVYWLNENTKERIIEQVIDQCKEEVLHKGADPESITLQYVKEYPFDYMQGEVLRVVVKVTGILK